jgi:hypothetical protein
MQCDEDFDNSEHCLIDIFQVYEDKYISITTEIIINQELNDDIEAEVDLNVYYNLRFRKQFPVFGYNQSVIYTKVGSICVDELLPHQDGIKLFERKLAMVKELHLCKKCNDNVNTYFLDIDGLCEDCYMAEP